MKKIIVLLGFMAVLFMILISCADDKTVPPVTPESLPKEPEIVGEEAVALYYSLNVQGFEKYMESFPTEWRSGLQEELEYTNEQFAEAMALATETVGIRLQDEYPGADFYIEYEFIGEREILDDEYSVLMDELSRYLYMSVGTIEDIKAQSYSVYTYGVDTEGYVVNENTYEEELYMLNITGEGWRVSPHEYNLP